MEFFGINDSNLEILRKYFPDLKLVARGDEIKVSGTQEQINLFKEKINILIEHYHKYGILNEDKMEVLLSDKVEGMLKETPHQGNGDVLVHGQNGIVVKARSVNRERW